MAVALCLLASPPLHAATFTLTIGNPAAAGPVTKVKNSVLAVRLEQCGDLSKSGLRGTAEGIVNNMRQSIPLSLSPTPTSGVYVVAQNWPAGGSWVVSLSATCSGAKAGAIVPFGPGGFLRESSKFFPRFATAAEIDASLKTLMGGVK